MSSAPTPLHAGFTQHFPRPATPSKSDLARLRASNESHFRNVYVAGKDSLGRLRYVAKVKSGGKLRCLPGSRSTSPEESAAAVLRWYERTFGAAWAEALLARKRTPWRVWKNRRLGGWCARVWLWGVPVEVPAWRVSRGRVVRSGRLAVWPTRAAARAGLWRFVRDSLGLLSVVAVWRTGQAPPEA